MPAPFSPGVLSGLPTEVTPFAPPMVQRIPTAAGLTTGTIAEAGRLQVVLVESAAADNIIILPPPVVGTIVILLGNATGYELRTTDPATIGINGGTGAGAESAIPASTCAILICQSATAWKGFQSQGTGGTLVLTEVAA
jgi:hypothetical protein